LNDVNEIDFAVNERLETVNRRKTGLQYFMIGMQVLPLIFSIKSVVCLRQ
jgi:hypothetical protein